MISTSKLSSQDMVGLDAVSYRPPTCAGTFYPENADTLRNWIKDYLGKSAIETEDEVYGLAVPHAGYVYSGWIAAKAYKQVQNKKYDVVIIIAPSHIVGFNGSSVFDGSGYETPLGTCEVDKELAKEITSSFPEVHLSRQGHDWHNSRSEHSLEVQIPFIQVVLPETPIVPIVMGVQTYESVDLLTRALVNSIKKQNKKALIIASTDLSHYHDTKNSKSLDKKIVKSFNSYDYFKLELNLFSKDWEACGGGPLAVMMMACEQLGANNSQSLLSANSSESPYIKSDPNRVVGYFSGIVTRSKEEIILFPRLFNEEKDIILRTAKESVKCAVMKTKFKEEKNQSKILKKSFATFVTLKKEGELRGCIGSVFSKQSLIESVEESGRLAATKDTRFNPVSEEELKDLEYEVTILSRMKKVLDLNEIVPGRDGVYLRLGYSSGLFLPQVAEEQEWDRLTLLEQIGRKAGLSTNSYLDPKAELYIFRGMIIK